MVASVDPSPPTGLLAAGGIGERARRSPDEAPKQFQLLAGRPVILWALDALIDGGCEPIVVVVPDGWFETAVEAVGDREVEVCIGGPTRQDSIHNGLSKVVSQRVVVQDASRPLVTGRLVASVLEGLDRADAAIAAVPMDETLKRGAQEVVTATVDRAGIYRAQTPAAFKTEVLKEAHRKAAEEGFIGTDEAQLIERYGGTVALVPGSRHNLKITWLEDFRLAEAILSVRGS